MYKNIKEITNDCKTNPIKHNLTAIGKTVTTSSREGNKKINKINILFE